jgi:hypothetical protein
MIDTFLLVLRTRVRARRDIEDGLPQWMVTPRAYPNRRLREPFRAPKKIHRQIRQPVRQGNTLLVRQFAATAALHLLQERPLDRVGGGLVCGFAFVAVAPLLLGGREGHAAYAGMVTLPSSSPVHSAVRHGERGVVFIEEFREPAPPGSPAVGDSYPLATLLFALGFPGPQWRGDPTGSAVICHPRTILKVARSLGIGTGTVQRISGERVMSLREAEQ